MSGKWSFHTGLPVVTDTFTSVCFVPDFRLPRSATSLYFCLDHTRGFRWTSRVYFPFILSFGAQGVRLSKDQNVDSRKHLFSGSVTGDPDSLFRMRFLPSVTPRAELPRTGTGTGTARPTLSPTHTDISHSFDHRLKRSSTFLFRF